LQDAFSLKNILIGLQITTLNYLKRQARTCDQSEEYNKDNENFVKIDKKYLQQCARILPDNHPARPPASPGSK